MKKLPYISVLILIIYLIAWGVINNDNRDIKNKQKDQEIGSKYTFDESRKISVPKNYPQDIVPIIPGGKVVASSKREDANHKSYHSVSIMLGKKPKEVESFYLKALKDAKNVKVDGGDNFSTITGIQKDRRVTISIKVAMVNGRKQTMVVILIAPK